MISFSEKITRRIWTLTRRFPFVTCEVIGTSRKGASLHALRIGYGAQSIGYNAAHHANEWITTLLLLRFIREYCATCIHTPELLETFTCYAIPLVNPDGADAVIQKKSPPDWKANACGIDLNANYPASWQIGRDNKAAQGYDQPGARGYPGIAPLCEPESTALAAYTQLRNFDLTISLHTQGEEIYHQYRHYNPPGAQTLIAEMTRVGRYPFVEVPEDASHGGYRDWFIEHFNRPGFTIECGLGENPLPPKDFTNIYKDIAPLLWVPFTTPTVH
ncbi:MAG: hypothetical protein FWC71_05535 [Defluviitaleaceae bacterium]|nr:hypothetical protein [Defluviitaleaceae bacterium]